MEKNSNRNPISAWSEATANAVLLSGVWHGYVNQSGFHTKASKKPS